MSSWWDRCDTTGTDPPKWIKAQIRGLMGFPFTPKLLTWGCSLQHLPVTILSLPAGDPQDNRPWVQLGGNPKKGLIPSASHMVLSHCKQSLPSVTGLVHGIQYRQHCLRHLHEFQQVSPSLMVSACTHSRVWRQLKAEETFPWYLAITQLPWSIHSHKELTFMVPFPT